MTTGDPTPTREVLVAELAGAERLISHLQSERDELARQLRELRFPETKPEPPDEIVIGGVHYVRKRQGIKGVVSCPGPSHDWHYPTPNKDRRICRACNYSESFDFRNQWVRSRRQETEAIQTKSEPLQKHPIPSLFDTVRELDKRLTCMEDGHEWNKPHHHQDILYRGCTRCQRTEKAEHYNGLLTGWVKV